MNLTSLLSVLSISLELNTEKEIIDGLKTILLAESLNAGQREILSQCVKYGPVADGNMISSSSNQDRKFLIEKGLLINVFNQGQDGYTAATYLGGRVNKIVREMFEIKNIGQNTDYLKFHPTLIPSERTYEFVGINGIPPLTPKWVPDFP